MFDRQIVRVFKLSIISIGLKNPESLWLHYEFNGLIMGFTFDIPIAKCSAFEKCYTHKCNNTTTTL